ncbi:MAG TPA: hypothetical protein VGQ39_17270 [Pyrinomonadaceae bacterium]|nr:hypothetical protein [Pyrinomonadaceae bacterium]
MSQATLGSSFQKHWGGTLPWGPTSERWREQAVDFKYDKAQTPRLIEVHGYSTVPYFAGTYAALKAAKIPVEFYLYPDAPHNLKSPTHRYNWIVFRAEGRSTKSHQTARIESKAMKQFAVHSLTKRDDDGACYNYFADANQGHKNSCFNSSRTGSI